MVLYRSPGSSITGWHRALYARRRPSPPPEGRSGPPMSFTTARGTSLVGGPRRATRRPTHPARPSALRRSSRRSSTARLSSPTPSCPSPGRREVPRKTPRLPREVDRIAERMGDCPGRGDRRGRGAARGLSTSWQGGELAATSPPGPPASRLHTRRPRKRPMSANDAMAGRMRVPAHPDPREPRRPPESRPMGGRECPERGSCLRWSCTRPPPAAGR
jgi:hypothetical protein